MKNIAIYGAGGFGREVACLLNIINEKEPTWNLVGFFDDGKEKGYCNKYGEILGGMADVNAWTVPLSIVIAIGAPYIVEKIVNGIHNSNIDYPNIIAPDTIFLDKSQFFIGQGNLVCPGCLFSTNVQIGNFNCFNGFITVGHDTRIENFNSIMPAVRVSGEVRIGKRNFLGVGSAILQQIKVGCDTVIGANSVVIRSTKDRNTYVGNPACIVKY